jgi:hypothetical protein
MVWEGYYGKIPQGYFIHHKDGNKNNNIIDNLALVSSLTHKRLHSGCKIIDGKWYKPCPGCNKTKSVDTEYYHIKGRGIGYICKSCWIENVKEKRKKNDNLAH